MILSIIDALLIAGFGFSALVLGGLWGFPRLRPYAQVLTSAWIGSALLTGGYRLFYGEAIQGFLEITGIDPNEGLGYLWLVPIGLIALPVLCTVIGAALGIAVHVAFQRNRPKTPALTHPEDTPS